MKKVLKNFNDTLSENDSVSILVKNGPDDVQSSKVQFEILFTKEISKKRPSYLCVIVCPDEFNSKDLMINLDLIFEKGERIFYPISEKDLKRGFKKIFFEFKKLGEQRVFFFLSNPVGPQDSYAAMRDYLQRFEDGVYRNKITSPGYYVGFDNLFPIELPVYGFNEIPIVIEKKSRLVDYFKFTGFKPVIVKRLKIVKSSFF